MKSDRKVSYKFILELDDSKSIIENLIEKEIQDFGYNSIRKQFEILEKKYNIQFEEETGNNVWSKNLNKINFKLITEIFSTRNIVLHNRGVINKTYLSINPETDFNLNDNRTITEDYLRDSIIFLAFTAFNITRSIKNKFEKKHDA